MPMDTRILAEIIIFFMAHTLQWVVMLDFTIVFILQNAQCCAIESKFLLKSIIHQILEFPKLSNNRTACIPLIDSSKTSISCSILWTSSLIIIIQWIDVLKRTRTNKLTSSICVFLSYLPLKYWLLSINFIVVEWHFILIVKNHTLFCRWANNLNVMHEWEMWKYFRSNFSSVYYLSLNIVELAIEFT